MSEETTTIRWIDRLGRLCELDVPKEKLELNQPITNCGEPRRYSPEQGMALLQDDIARLQARQDQITARRDELVDEYPDLKSEG